MQIKSFRIRGFKSIADVEVDNLNEINLFYGLNDVGKSNIFQSLALWRQMATMTQAEISLEQLEQEFGPSLFRLGGDNEIRLRVEIILDRVDFPDWRQVEFISKQSTDTVADQYGFGALELDPDVESTSSPLDPLDELRIVSEVVISLLQSDQIQYRSTNQTVPNLLPKGKTLSLSFLPNFHIISAMRRFRPERWDKRNDLGVISDHNLKQALFYAYLSRNLRHKQRLEAIKRVLAEPPFNLGQLDIALDPATDRIDIGFSRPEGRLPLENLGSGSQQLLIVLGQLVLSDYPIIAIEEPEMNLSPQYQQHLLIVLRELMQDPDVGLDQLFISTHSPYFEFEQSFFDVTLDEERATQVARLPVEKRDRYFPPAQAGPQTGARLNSFNQITLYEGVIKDLELKRGDLVLFTKNEAGRWEIRPEGDIIEELGTISSKKDGQ
jgi:hypothetical protein